MPVDTAAKRSQMLAFGSGDTLPIPDGTIAQADRQHLLWLYGGILFAAATQPTGRLEYTMPLSLMEYTMPRDDWDFTVPVP